MKNYYERRTINVNAWFGINIKLIFTKNESVIGSSIRKTDGINIKLIYSKNENLLWMMIMGETPGV